MAMNKQASIYCLVYTNNSVQCSMFPTVVCCIACAHCIIDGCNISCIELWLHTAHTIFLQTFCTLYTIKNST